MFSAHGLDATTLFANFILEYTVTVSSVPDNSFTGGLKVQILFQSYAIIIFTGDYLARS